MFLLLAAFAGNPVPRNPEIDPVDESVAEGTVGTVLFDVRLPAEIRIDDAPVAQLYTAGRFSVDSLVGTRAIQIITNGVPQTLAIDVLRTGKTVVLVGRNGLTSSHLKKRDVIDGDVPVELRVAGNQGVLVTVDQQRWHLDARGTKEVVIPVGSHKMTVQSGDGHVLWARGRLVLESTDSTIVQLSEGRLPEVSGSGAAFHPGR